VRKTEIAKGYSMKRNIKRVGEEWRKRATDKWSWRLLIEKVVREN